MARYTGSVCKLCRREGEKLFLKGSRCISEKCSYDRRPFPPGDHGKRRMKFSEYSHQLREKQKAKRIYGLLEKQFKGNYTSAARKRGITGEVLLTLLERRMDNVVYRMGFAASRKESRQLVRHGHFMLNGRKIDIPSAIVSENDIIQVKEKSTQSAKIRENAESSSKSRIPEWLEVDSDNYTGKVLRLPTRDDVDIPVKEQLIVELYSK